MATKKTSTTDLPTTLTKLQAEYARVRLEIKAGKIKNFNAHKSLKKQIAQTLTKMRQENL